MYDITNLEKLSAFSKAVPEAMASFQAFDKAALADGAIPKKYKELMAVAVGLTTQCPYCIDVHRKAALNAGATEQELAETTFVAAALRAGGAVARRWPTALTWSTESESRCRFHLKRRRGFSASLLVM
jgi:AhpD family alkylhydroperoxidase